MKPPKGGGKGCLCYGTVHQLARRLGKKHHPYGNQCRHKKGGFCTQDYVSKQLHEPWYHDIPTASPSSPVVLVLDLSQRYREQHILCRRHLDALGLGQHVVARAQVAAHLRLPVRYIPLQALRGDDAGLLERDNADVLPEDVVSGVVVAHVDLVNARFEQEGQARAGQQEDAALGIVRVWLVEVKVMQLAEALVHTAADAPKSDNINT